MQQSLDLGRADPGLTLSAGPGRVISQFLCPPRELTPLEEASLQNQKLRAAYEARVARLNPSQAVQKTSLASGDPLARARNGGGGWSPARLHRKPPSMKHGTGSSFMAHPLCFPQGLPLSGMGTNASRRLCESRVLGPRSLVYQSLLLGSQASPAGASGEPHSTTWLWVSLSCGRVGVSCWRAQLGWLLLQETRLPSAGMAQGVPLPPECPAVRVLKRGGLQGDHGPAEPRHNGG